MQPKIFSSPGKALLAGGYLVLDPTYEAFVVALSSRMHAAVTTLKKLTSGGQTRITVKSPQFKLGEWTYVIDTNRLLDMDLSEVSGRKNPFVKSTIVTILSYLRPSTSYEIVITIFSDSEYHSQIGSTPRSSSNGKRTFYYHNKPINDVPKTGLGSSAGLVTSLTAALLYCYTGDGFLTNQRQLDTLHNLAQVAHCLAQGKVGSGFDVASAVYGSIVYRRFKPALINDLVALEPARFSDGLGELIDKTNWNIEHQRCCLVPGIHILMGDVAGGSETPKLVTKVQKWRLENPDRAPSMWTALNESNMGLVASLTCLEQFASSNKQEYAKLLEYLDAHSARDISASEKPAIQLLKDVVSSIRSIRKLLKIMTVESGAEIEPDEQTTLLDNCEALDGCLGGVVPGAGGYDAICLLVSENSIKKIIKSSATLAEFQHVHWLRLLEQRHGLIEEQASDFDGLF